MKYYLYCFLLLLPGCGPKAEINVNGVSIPDDILMGINDELGLHYEEFNDVRWVYHDNAPDAPVNAVGGGICYRYIEEAKAKEIFEEYYDDVIASGNYIFLTKLEFDEKNNARYTLVITKADSPYSVIKLMDTSGPNYDIDNAAVIRHLKKWDEQAQLKYVVIDDDRVEAYISELPEDVHKFTSEIHELCPDVIQQGYGSMEEMEKSYKKDKYFWLWWD